MKRNSKQLKQRNFVAKHMRTFNKSSVIQDKKKEAKKNGYTGIREEEYTELD